MKAEIKAKLNIMLSMVIFGTIGLFVRRVFLPSSVIALVRGFVGVAFLLVVMKLRKIKMDWFSIRKNLLLLLLSGAGIGFNWILLFESYRYTTVAVSTVCYYFAPIIVVALSPFLLRERLTLRKSICVAAALFGVVLVSGLVQSQQITKGDMKGIALGLGAAVIYGSVVLMNKHMHGLSAYDRTVLQLGASAVILLPYCLLTVSPEQLCTDGLSLLILLFLGIIHTGLAYFLYFGAIDHISGQTAAIISYIDPVVAVLISLLVLREPLTPAELMGAVLIVGAALVSELPAKGGKT